MTPWHVLLWLVSAALAAGVGAWIGHYKGRQVQGAWMGFLAGWIGVLILVFLPKTHDRKVQEARERRQIEADALLAAPTAP